MAILLIDTTEKCLARPNINGNKLNKNTMTLRLMLVTVKSLLMKKLTKLSEYQHSSQIPLDVNLERSNLHRS